MVTRSGGILASVLLILGAAEPSLGEDFLKRCGDCWCIFDPAEETCPEFSPGHYDYLPDDVRQAYASLELSGEAPKLAAPDGTDCYPFTHLGKDAKNPNTDLPQCEPPEMSDAEEAVCAFHYVSVGGDCRGYEMETYPSRGDVPEGWVVTHEGACGVCSTAADLAVMGDKSLDISTKSTECGTVYFIQVYTVNKDATKQFNALTQCLKEKIGYTDSCALLWAHSISTTAPACAAKCSASVGQPESGDPPECAQNDCIVCTEDLQRVQFAAHAGRADVNSGITQSIARPCSEFPSIPHELPVCASGEGAAEPPTTAAATTPTTPAATTPTTAAATPPTAAETSPVQTPAPSPSPNLPQDDGTSAGSSLNLPMVAWFQFVFSVFAHL